MASHKLEKVQPAWRDRIAHLKIVKSDQEKKEGSLVPRVSTNAAGGQGP